jgi:hypothetical protein
MIPDRAPFYRLLRRLEAGYHEFLDADAALDFGPDWAAYRKAGFVRPADPATAARCPDCETDPWPVTFLGDSVPAICCPGCGPVRISADDLRTSMLDVPALLSAIGTAAKTAARPVEVAPGVWRLGPVRSAVRSKEVYIAATRDAGRLRAAAPTFSGRRPVLFFPTPPGVAAWPGPAGPLVAPLTEYLDVTGSEIHFDHAAFAELLRGDRGVQAPKRPRNKRADRAAKIERLTELMNDHMTLAHAEAIASMSRHGYVELTPRPTQKKLAERVTMSESSVSRCLNDKSPAGRALKKLWEMSTNPHDVLRWRQRR